MAYLNAEIIRLYRAGKTLNELGIQYGLTRERMRQLIQKGIYFEVQKIKGLKKGEQSIEVLNLSNRPFNGLISAGIISVNRLVSLTEDDIMSLPAMGSKGLKEIKDKLFQNSLFLREKNTDTHVEELIEKYKPQKYTPVETLQLSARTLNALIKNNIWGVEQLMKYSFNQLKNLSGIGKRAIDEIKEKTHKNELSINNGENKTKIVKEEQKYGIFAPILVSQEELDIFFSNLKQEHRKSWILKQKDDVRKLAQLAENCYSISKFLSQSKIGKKETLKECYPEIYEILLKNIQEIKKRWHKYYVQCVECGTTVVPYRSHGRCKNCYYKSDEWKRVQKASLERNKEKWKERMRAYSREYLQRPEIKAKKRHQDDIKNYGGNREKAIARDNYQCISCKISREEAIKTLGEDFCVIRLDGNRKNNDLNNLRTLCRKCFLKQHFRRNK